MVIANRFLQEVFAGRFVVKSDKLLSAAQISLRTILNQLSFFCKEALKVSRYFKYSYRTFLHKSSDSYSYAGFKVGIEFISFYKVERNCAVSKKNLSLLKYLVEKARKNGQLALMLEYKVSPAQGVPALTPLGWAARNCNRDIYNYLVFLLMFS